MQPSLASLGQAPGIAPPDYAYLDNASVALYLGQLEGGIAQSDKLTQQLTQGRSASVSAGGLSLGGQTGSSAQAERVVTPTATARFYQLLDLLGRDGYLHTVDMASSPAQIRQGFASVPEGSFVKLTGCQLEVPSYVQLAERAPGTTDFETNLYQGAGQMPEVANDAIGSAEQMAGRIKQYQDNADATVRGMKQHLTKAVNALAKAAGRNPRVPLSSCDGQIDFRPRGVDLLFPIHLENLSTEQSLLAGPVTLVGKLVRAVKNPDETYVDEASLGTFDGPVSAVDAAYPNQSQPGAHTLEQELQADTVVLSPGAVILPVAIYK